MQTLFIISCTLGKEREKQHARNLFRGVARDCISVCLYASFLCLHYLGSSSAFTEGTHIQMHCSCSYPSAFIRRLLHQLEMNTPLLPLPVFVFVCECVNNVAYITLHSSTTNLVSIFIYFRLRVIDIFRCLLQLCLFTDLTIIVIGELKGSATLPFGHVPEPFSFTFDPHNLSP